MRVENALRAAGDTHPGLQRSENEDRFHYDPTRGIFLVVDGVGGHAAGEQAADTAVTMLRARLERETGPVDDRIREAITIANNEIHRRASLRPEWKGMGCVLTVAVVDNGGVTVGHVGDTRLYKLRRGEIVKVTRDHSPVGEREDSHQLSEAQAMRHPRRNEVYRDVGAEPHETTDPEFIDILKVPFEPDAALLLCSDGLTDTVSSTAIGRVVEEYAGHPYEVVRALIDAANDGGGKDNVTVRRHRLSGSSCRPDSSLEPVACRNAAGFHGARTAPIKTLARRSFDRFAVAGCRRGRLASWPSVSVEGPDARSRVEYQRRFAIRVDRRGHRPCSGWWRGDYRAWGVPRTDSVEERCARPQSGTAIRIDPTAGRRLRN
jgi:serine/threonine protein phosphatase PrpC